MKRLTKATLRTAINLFLFSLIGTAILAFTYQVTHQLIAKSEDTAKLKLINQVVPLTLYDNDLIDDTLTLPASSLLGSEQDTIAYRGRLHGQPSVVVLEATAPDGYSGKITMILAINHDGTVNGVRIITHKETPGLGDYIDVAKNSWIKIFQGASLAGIQEPGWKVKKDGGQFDYMAGATITPRAVVKAVHKALKYFETNRDKLFVTNAKELKQQGEVHETSRN